MKLRSIPHYLKNPKRIWDQWRYKKFLKQNPDVPCISPDCITFLDRALSNNMNALEWGSGRSSLWYAKRVKKLLSIEHNESWHKEVVQKLSHTKNATCRFIPLDHPESEPTLVKYHPWPRYVAVVSEFDQEPLDFVVIDGHYRQACVVAVLDKMASGGLLLIDNSNWMPLKEWNVPESWPIVHQSDNGVTCTTVWKKPGPTLP